jgi:hypothetical protein
MKISCRNNEQNFLTVGSDAGNMTEVSASSSSPSTVVAAPALEVSSTEAAISCNNGIKEQDQLPESVVTPFAPSVPSSSSPTTTTTTISVSPTAPTAVISSSQEVKSRSVKSGFLEKVSFSDQSINQSMLLMEL